METIIAALVSGVLSGGTAIIVCVLNNRTEAEKNRALIEYRMTELEKKVDKHNNLIERTYNLEQDAAVIKEQIKVANHRIEDLEKGA
jgi:hypothetical protein